MFQASFCDGDLFPEEGKKFSGTITGHASWQFSITFSGWEWIAPKYACLMDPVDHDYACEPATDTSEYGGEYFGELDEDYWQFFGHYALYDNHGVAGTCLLLAFSDG
jgi:hypothetical protein